MSSNAVLQRLPPSPFIKIIHSKHNVISVVKDLIRGSAHSYYLHAQVSEVRNVRGTQAAVITKRKTMSDVLNETVRTVITWRVPVMNTALRHKHELIIS